MKKIIFLLLISSAAIGQTDSSKIPVRLSLNQKHIAYMGVLLSERNTLQDKRVYDTLIHCIGSGTQPDSITRGTFRADYVYRFIRVLTDEQTGAAYDFFKELIQGRSGWTGLQSQLNFLSAAGNGGAIWLRREIVELMARQEAVLNEKIKGGADYLKAPLEY